MKWRQRIVRKERKTRKLTSDITVFSKTRHCRGLTSLLLVMSKPTPWLALQINFTCGRTTSFLHSLTLPTKVHFCHICVWQSRELLFQGVWRIVKSHGIVKIQAWNPRWMLCLFSKDNYNTYSAKVIHPIVLLIVMGKQMVLEVFKHIWTCKIQYLLLEEMDRGRT